MKRLSWMLALIGASAGSFASFELVLVADQATAGRIHRFDGENGIYLGSFGFTGGFYGSANSMIVVQTRNECWVNEGSKVHRFNYNTGAYLGLFETGVGMTSMSVSRNGQSIYVFNNTNSFREFSASTLGLMNTYTFAGTGKYFSGAESLTGRLVVQDTQTAGQIAYTQLTLSSLAIASGINFSGTGRHMSAIPRIDLSGPLGSNWDNLGVIGTTGDFGSLHGISISTGLFATYYVTPSNFNLTSIALSSGAHQGTYFGGTDSGGNWLITHRSPIFSPMNTFGAGYLTSPFAMATVIAPEPGSMLALGMGAVALLRRRRSK